MGQKKGKLGCHGSMCLMEEARVVMRHVPKVNSLGPPETSRALGEHARRVLLARWTTLLHYRAACLVHDDVDTVHDLRVATRRMRAALDLFRTCLPGDDIDAAYGQVRRLTRGVGRLRDVDEALLFFGQIATEYVTKSRMFAGLLRHLGERRSRESKRVRKRLKRFPTDEIGTGVVRLGDALAAGDMERATRRHAPTLTGYFFACSIRLFDSIEQLQALAGPEEHVTQRHALRIAIKRWRYFMEICGDVFGVDYRLLLEQLKEYQTLLGHLNDLAVFAALADECGLSDEERRLLVPLAALQSKEYLLRFAALSAEHPLRYEFRI